MWWQLLTLSFARFVAVVPFFHESLIIREGIANTLQFQRVFHCMWTTTLNSVYFSVLALSWSNPFSFWQYITSRFLDIGWNTPSRNRNITRRISGRFGGASEGRRSWGGLGRASPTSSHQSAPHLEIWSAVQTPVVPSKRLHAFFAALVFGSANERIRTLCKVSWEINICLVITL